MFHLRFWVGWLYQILSDFGRSMVRPLLWLGIGLLAFAGIYASQNPAVWQQPFAAYVVCTAGSGDVRAAALELSVHNAVPFAGIGASGRLEQVYACLYGIQTDMPSIPGQLPTGFAPVIPYGISFAGVLQFLVSAVLDLSVPAGGPQPLSNQMKPIDAPGGAFAIMNANRDRRRFHRVPNPE